MSDQDQELIHEAEQRVGVVLAGKWTLVRVLGVGGMAAVYEAVHRAGASVAIKVLHAGLVSHPEALERFKREAYIANRVDHPGVVKVLDDDVTPTGEPFFVMELLRGESLEDRVARAGGKLPLAQVLAIAERVLSVLEAAHAKGIVHRDLKPDNVFLTSDGHVKVLDFGIARLREGNVKKTRTGMMLGTPAFMSPEQALGRADDIGPPTDVWALGAMMFSLITGRFVHEAESASQMLVHAGTRPAPSIARFAELPLSVVRVVDRALEFDAHKRFPTAVAMRAAIVEAMADPASADARTSGRPPALARTLTGPPPADDRAIDLDVPKPAPVPSRASRPAPARPDAGELGLDTSFATSEEAGALIELFTLLERALFAAAQYGLDHPEAARRLDASLERCADALRASDAGLVWNVAPYGFLVGGKPVWEPRAPFDRIPYQLFADGVRTLGLLPGLDAEEFRRLVRIMTADRARDMAPEDDFVTLLWEAGFEHVAYQAIDAFVEGDQRKLAKFEDETKRVVALANFDTSFQLEDCWQERERGPTPGVGDRQRRIAALLGGGDRAGAEAVVRAEALKPTGSTPPLSPVNITLPAETAAALEARMQIATQTLGERFALATSLAWADGVVTKQHAAVATPLRAAVDSLSATAPRAAIDLVGALCGAFDRTMRDPRAAERLRAMLAGAIVSPATMKRLLEGVTHAGEHAPVFARGLTALLGWVDDAHVPAAIGALATLHDPALVEAVLGYLARAGRGHEARMSSAFAEADLELGLSLIRVLGRIGTPEARNAVMRASTSPHAVVRIEALSHLEGVASERVRLELKALLEDREIGVRTAALKAMQQHHVRAAGPGLVLRIRSPEFDKLSNDEKRLALETLVALAPARAEAVCLELLAEARVVSSEAHEHSRAMAAEILGRIGTSPEVLEALGEASSSRWRNSERVRQTAQRAKSHMEIRLSQPPIAHPPGGSVPPVSVPVIAPNPAPVITIPPANGERKP